MTEKEKTIATISAVVALMDSKGAAARAMKVNPSTIYRWLQGQSILEGPALGLARAIIRHPEDYQSAKKRADS